MNTVYDLWYVRGYPDREDTELHIGVYSSEQSAQAAISRLQIKPGFMEWPDGFEIHETQLDRDNWANGFRSVIGPVPEETEADAFDLPYWPEKAA